ncbi:MAG: hypothetical protein Q9172_000539 [Xanthocarpia lactea]
MTDARRIDLNYGHFGEPFYDLESREWRFSRDVDNVAPKLQVLGQPRTLLSSQLLDPTKNARQPSLQRKQNIDKLIQHYPELAPSAGLLPSLEEASGADQESSKDYDCTLSERVVFGQALHPGHPRGDSNTVPVIAFVGGPAGELVRVVQLTPETLGLGDGANLQFRGQVFQTRVQGLWHGTHGPVQQLQFAASDGKLTEWLAVRHGGGTSILRIILRESEVPTLYRLPHIPVLRADVEIRMELEHIVLLPMQGDGTLHTDICFNPWRPLEIAVLDQSSHWNIWKIKSVNKHTKVWTVEAGPSGYLVEEAPDRVEDSTKYDGWGALRFVGNGAYLLVCNRKHIARFKLRGEPVSSSGPELGLSTSADWILDVRQGSMVSESIFITTSSRIFWIHLAPEYIESTEPPRLNVKILLAWTHFRNREDVSLSTQIVSMQSRTIVLLYSRLTGLKTLFTLNQGGHLPSSSRNPYLLQIPGSNDSEVMRCSTIVLEAVSHNGYKTFDRNGGDWDDQKNNIWVLRCMTLNSDLSLHECFLIASHLELHYQTSEGLRSLRRAIPPKSSYRIRENFIIPNGLMDDDVQEWPAPTIESSIQNIESLSELQHRDLSLQEDEWTINLEWLTQHISSPVAPPLDEILQLVLDRLYNNDDLSGQAVASLEELIGQDVAASDVDLDSIALTDFLRSVERRRSADEFNMEHQPAVPILIARLSSPSLLLTLDTPLKVSLSQVYHTLMDSWMLSLTPTVSNRVRSATERVIGLVATQLQLASNGISRLSTGHRLEQEREPNDRADRRALTLTLPVRQVTSRLERPRQAFPEHDPRPLTSFGNKGSMPAVTLPTPEPTPSLRTQGSQSSLAESEDSGDTAMQRLSIHGKTSSQTPLSSSSIGILSKWTLGQDPADYDWQVEKIQGGASHEPDDAEESRREKKRRHRERMAMPQHMAMEGPSSQPMPSRLAASQDNMQPYIQESSQPRPISMSQPQPGRHGGGKTAKKKPKKAGFR